MKWYKHISDSLDDPFICDLMDDFGPSAYLVFFGVLEIYARENKIISKSNTNPKENDHNLIVSWSYLHHKLKISSQKIKKILSKITKWKIIDNGEQVSIYIPKFEELMDEWSTRKLGSSSGVTRELLRKSSDMIKILDKDINPPTPLNLQTQNPIQNPPDKTNPSKSEIVQELFNRLFQEESKYSFPCQLNNISQLLKNKNYCHPDIQSRIIVDCGGLQALSALDNTALRIKLYSSFKKLTQ